MHINCSTSWATLASAMGASLGPCVHTFAVPPVQSQADPGPGIRSYAGRPLHKVCSTHSFPCSSSYLEPPAISELGGTSTASESLRPTTCNHVHRLPRAHTSNPSIPAHLCSAHAVSNALPARTCSPQCPTCPASVFISAHWQITHP